MDILSYVLGFNKGKAQGGSGAIKKDILPLEAVNFSKNMGGTYTGYFSGIFALKAGNTYYVEWDGETYKCEAFAHTDAVCSYVRLGNCSEYGGPGNDEPFTISIILDSLTRMVEALEDDKATHTISIYQIIGGSSADDRVKYVTFMYGAQELEKYPVIVGDTVRDRAKDNGWAEDTKLTGWVESPLIPSTDAKIYPVIGWSSSDDDTSDGDALQNVTEDRTVYAVVMEKPRKYAANFFDDTGALVKSQRVAYGTPATPPDTFREGYIFNGWALSDGTISTDLVITADTDFYGSWELDQGWIVPMTLPSGITGAYCAKYSHDGTRLFFGYSGKLYMYDTTTEPYTLLHSVNQQNIGDMDVSPDGKWLAIALVTSSYNAQQLITIYKIGDSTLTLSSSVIPSLAVAAKGYCYSCSFSADSSKLIVAHSKGTFFVLNVTTSTWTGTMAPMQTSYKMLHTQISPDSQMVTCLKESTGTKSLYIFDTTVDYAEVTSTYISQEVKSYVTSYYGDQIAYSPDGKYLACVFNGNRNYSASNSYLIVYDTTTVPYTEVKRVIATSVSVEAVGVAFNGDGSLMAVARNNSPYIEIYDTSTWELKEAPMVLPTDTSICCAFSVNNHLLVSGSSASILYKVK